MISMYTKQEIILRYHVEGKSQRSISRELQVSRTTVKKYVSFYEKKFRELGNHHQALQACLSAPVHYDSSTRQKKKLSDQVTAKIDKLLEDNVVKRSTGLHKQVLKKVDIYEKLQEDGFDIGYTTVCKYIKGKLDRSTKEAFIRQEYAPGSSCEFDWGEVKLMINGKQSRFQLAIFASSYSNYRYAALYHRQDSLAFMEAHVGFMNHCQGAFRQMVYDNMRVAISKFVGKQEKVPTQALLDLRAHYQFTHRFCNFYRGNEKGHVERSVEYIRRKTFGSKDTFESLSEAKEYLQKSLDKLNGQIQKQTGKTAYELLEEEKPYLRPFAQPMECSLMEELRVDKYATISHKTNRYSVPENLVGKFVQVKVYSHRLEIFHDNTRVAHHARCYHKHQWIIHIEHYLETFKTKPGALANSTALLNHKYLKRVFDQYFGQQPRAFIDLLQYCYTQNIDEEQFSITLDKLLSSTTRQDLSADAMMALLGNTPDPMSSLQGDGQSKIDQLSKATLQQAANLFSN